MKNKLNYKKYIKEIYGISNLMIESPSDVPQFLNRFDSDPVLNRREAEKIEKRDKLIGIFKNGEQNFRIYKTIEDGMIFMNLLVEKQSHIALIHEFEEIKIDNKIGISSKNIWQEKHTFGLARYWILEYILKNYEFISSDESHTPMGKLFWKKLISDVLDKKFKPFVYNTKTKEYIEINNNTNLESYWGAGKGMYKFIIFKK
jgi:hypothetical protein